MTTYDSSGYMANRPVKPDRWREVCGDAPDGVVVSRNTVPPGFLLMQNFLSAAECDALVAQCEAQEGVRHTVSNLSNDPQLETVQNDGRTSELVDIRTLKADIVGLVRNAYVNLVAPHFQKQIEWFELPEILRYRPGGEYKPHTDADNWFPGEQTWKRAVDRDLSLLVYLNDGFEGGEIVFPNFGLSLQPKRGLLIAFPSDRRYLHAARPVRSGIRYALVSWAATRGSERVSASPRPHAIRV